MLGKLRTASAWLQWIEPWYLAYALIDVSVGGLVPILLPLMVHAEGGATQGGIVMTAFNLGGLSAPVWGVLAGRYRLHRWTAISGSWGFFALYPVIMQRATASTLGFQHPPPPLPMGWGFFCTCLRASGQSGGGQGTSSKLC